MQKWEYKWEPVAKFTPDYRNRLNELGDEGWEFVGLLPGDGMAQHFVLFKRPKPSKPEQNTGGG
jgi:hypothetical protein